MAERKWRLTTKEGGDVTSSSERISDDVRLLGVKLGLQPGHLSTERMRIRCAGTHSQKRINCVKHKRCFVVARLSTLESGAAIAY